MSSSWLDSPPSEFDLHFDAFHTHAVIKSVINCHVNKMILLHGQRGLPILQFFPVYPGTQLQLKSFTASVQLPPFSHGPSAQSSISWRKFKIRKTFWNILRNSCNTKFYYPSIKDCNIIALVALSGCIDFFRIPDITTFGSASKMIVKLKLN